MKYLLLVFILSINFLTYGQDSKDGDVDIKPSVSIYGGVVSLPAKFEKSGVGVIGVNLTAPIEMLNDKVSLNFSVSAGAGDFVSDTRLATDNEIEKHGLFLCPRGLCTTKPYYSSMTYEGKDYYVENGEIMRKIFDKERIRLASIEVAYNVNEWISAGLTYTQLMNNFNQLYGDLGYQITFSTSGRGTVQGMMQIGSNSVRGNIIPNYVNVGLKINLNTKNKKQKSKGKKKL